MGYPDLKASLLKHLGITASGLSRKITPIKQQTSTEAKDATIILAHKEGFHLTKYFKGDELERIRNLVNGANSSVKQITVQSHKKTAKTNKTSRPSIKMLDGFIFDDPILSPAKVKESKEMANIYPYIYIMENSIRKVIDSVMSKEYGSNWWETKMNVGGLKGLKAKVSDHKNREERKRWHQRKGDKPIDYLDLKDLPIIVQQYRSNFKPIIDDFHWFEQLVKEVYESRVVVCHMNPLDKNNIQSVTVKFNQWEKLINSKKEEIQ